MPEALIIVWFLTFVTLVLALTVGEASPGKAVQAWNQGFWELLKPSMQICVMLITGYVVARAPILQKAWELLSRLPSPDKPAQAILLLSVFSMVTACIHWGLSLMGSSMLAVFLARRIPTVNYRLLVASAYLGLGCTWHAGLTGTAPLWANTPDNPVQKIVPELIPQSQTIFTAFNIVLLLIVIVAVAVLMYKLHPRGAAAHQPNAEQREAYNAFAKPEKPRDGSFSSRLLWWPGFNVAVVIMGVLALYYQARGAANISALFTFDNTNFIFLILGIGLQFRPLFFVKAVEEAGRAVWAIIIQFPFYAGIFGLLSHTGLGESLTRFFVAIGSAASFPLITYWYSGVLNYFVPSGASEWLITSPYLVPAARNLGVPMPRLILAYSWGNMMTDMIQPFFALPMLAVAKLQFREIAGYLMLVFVLYFIITSAAFFIWPRM